MKKDRIYDEANPHIKNDRYAIVLCTDSSWPFGDDMGKVLTNHYGYTSQNLWKYVGSDATFSNFKKAVNNIANLSDKNDIVFIGISSHGGYGGMEFNDGSGNPHGPFVSYSIIDSLLDRINTMILIVMIDNCYSGSALNYLNTGPCPRIVYTSCKADETSYVGDFDWAFPAALGNDDNAYQSADNSYGDSNGYVSVKEAYLYAQDYTITNFGVHPQALYYYCSDAYVGEHK